jgi:hypothetical protein
MNRLAIDDAPKVVQEFFASLELKAGGIAVELHGRTLCEVLPPPTFEEKDLVLNRGRRLLRQARERNADVDAQVLDREIDNAVTTVRQRRQA